MSEVTNDRRYELMKRMHGDIALLKDGLGEVRQELISMRFTLMGMQNDIHNIYGILGRHDDRLDRIERRLELRELAEAQRPYTPGGYVRLPCRPTPTSPNS